jgi:hypothetical protein
VTKYKKKLGFDCESSSSVIHLPSLIAQVSAGLIPRNLPSTVLLKVLKFTSMEAASPWIYSIFDTGILGFKLFFNVFFFHLS